MKVVLLKDLKGKGKKAMLLTFPTVMLLTF